MTTITFDTLPYIKKLRKAGVPDKQAEVHVEVTTDIMKNHIATKQDVFALKQDLKLLKADLTLRMGTIATAAAIAVLTLMPVIFKLVSLI